MAAGSKRGEGGGADKGVRESGGKWQVRAREGGGKEKWQTR